MKSLEALASGTFTTSDIVPALPKIIAKEIERGVYEKSIAQQLCRVDRSLVGKGQTLTVLKLGQVDATVVSEGTDLDSALSAQKPNVTSVHITPIKIATRLLVTKELEEDQGVEILALAVEDAQLKIADLLDEKIFETLLGVESTVTAYSGGATTTTHLALASGYPVLKIVSVVAEGATVTDYTVKYWNNGSPELIFSSSKTSATVTYKISTHTTNVVEANTKGQLAYKDLLKAKRKIRVQKFDANVAVLYPEEVEDLVNEVKNFDTYGTNEVLLNGEVGKLGGLKILETTKMYPGVGLVLDTKRCAVYVPKRKLTVTKQEKPNLDATAIYMYMRAGVGVVREEALSIITGAQSDAV